MNLSKEDIKRLLETDEFSSMVDECKKIMHDYLPPKPEMPKDVPQDFKQALYYKGPCAIPLWSEDKWRFAIFIEGEQIIDVRTNRGVMFDSYDEAITQVRGYLEYKEDLKRLLELGNKQMEWINVEDERI